MAEEAATTTTETTTETTAEATTETAAQTATEATKSTEAATETAPIDWRSAVSKDDLKKHAERFSTLDDVLQGNLDMRSKLSTAIIKPGKNAKPEEIQAWNKALGIPDNQDGYQYVPAKEFEAEFKAPEAQERLKSFNAVAHKAGLSADGYKAIMDWRNAEIAKDQRAIVEADKKFADDSEAALKKEWGKDYDRNKEFANRGAEALFKGDFKTFRELEMKDKRFLADHPVMVKAMAEFGRMTSEDGLGPVPMSDSDMTSLRAQLEDLTAKKMDAQNDGKDAEAKRLHGEIIKISKRIAGTRAYSGPSVAA